MPNTLSDGLAFGIAPCGDSLRSRAAGGDATDLRQGIRDAPGCSRAPRCRKWLSRSLLFTGARIDPALLDSPLFITRVCLVYFGLSGFVLCLQGHPALTLLRDRRLCYLGTISYGLYLYHPMVFGGLPSLCKRLFRRFGMSPSTLMVDLALLFLCFVAAEVSRRYVEGPILALKERLTFKARDAERGYRGPHTALVASEKSRIA